MTRTITRIDAARCQIEGAIRAYFLDDLVSALTLAGAAERVLSDLQPQDGLFGVDAYSWRSMINLHIKQEHQKEAAKIYRSGYDQLRHADYFRSETIDISEKMVDQYIFMAILALSFLTKSMTKDTRLYQVWYSVHYPHIVKKGTEFADKLEKAGPMPKGMTKQEFYQMGQRFFPNWLSTSLRRVDSAGLLGESERSKNIRIGGT